MKNLRGLAGLNNGVAVLEMEMASKALREAAMVSEIGAVLSEEAVKELVWTVDKHVGNIIGHYYADESSLVGMTTWAGERLLAMVTVDDVIKTIADKYLAKDYKGSQTYVSQFTNDDMALLTGCRGLKAKVVVVKGSKHASKILKALKNWNLIDATEEEVAAFKGDMQRMIRACQEIEIDITKDKTLVRFMELADMVNPGSYILTHKFKTRKTRTNPGLVTNIKELRKVRLEEDRADIAYNVSIGHLSYQVGSEEIDEAVADRSEVIAKDLVKIVDKEMVEEGVVDQASKFQERLMDSSMKIAKAIVSVAKGAKTDYVITDTFNDIQNNTLPESVLDLAKDFNPTIKAVADFDRIIANNDLADKKGLRQDISDIGRNTAKMLWLSNDHIHTATTPEALSSMGTTLRRLFSKTIVASELYTRDEKEGAWDFTMKHSIPTTKQLFKAEYLTLAVENQTTEFIVNEYPTFGIANDVADGEVIVKARSIVKDGEIVGRIITDKLSKEVTGRKFYLERNEEGMAMLVEKMSIQAMGAFPESKDLLITTEAIMFDGYTREDLFFTGKNQDNEELHVNRQNYIEELKEVLVESEDIVYSYENHALVVDGIEISLTKKTQNWKNLMMGLISNPKQTPEENKKRKHKIAKENVVKEYAVKDVYFSGNKLAMIVAAK